MNYIASREYEHQWTGRTHGYNSLLKLNEAFATNFTGKFYISLEFEDGTILKDSTQTVTITP